MVTESCRLLRGLRIENGVNCNGVSVPPHIILSACMCRRGFAADLSEVPCSARRSWQRLVSRRRPPRPKLLPPPLSGACAPAPPRPFRSVPWLAVSPQRSACAEEWVSRCRQKLFPQSLPPSRTPLRAPKGSRLLPHVCVMTSSCVEFSAENVPTRATNAFNFCDVHFWKANPRPPACQPRKGTACQSVICLLAEHRALNSHCFGCLLIFFRPYSPAEMLDQVDVFIFDCDGVIWKGDSVCAFRVLF